MSYPKGSSGRQNAYRFCRRGGEGGGQTVPKVFQGTPTLFSTASDSFKEPSAAPVQRKTETGLETTLRLAVGKSSTVAVVFKNSWWTQKDAVFKDGQNRTLNLEWTLAF